MTDTPKPVSRNAAFVGYTISRIANDKGLAAKLKRADNPSTEYMCWDFIAQFGIALDVEQRRLPFTTVAALIARDKADRNGTLTLGQALARSYPDGSQSKPAQAKLRRLLACNDIAELCMILRPVLTLIRSRTSQKLDYIQLLNQLNSYTFDPDRIRARWAQQFYSTVDISAKGDKQ